MKKKILLIEDDLTIQTQLKTLLAGNGYDVFAVTDFSRAIGQIKDFLPHLVIPVSYTHLTLPTTP